MLAMLMMMAMAAMMKVTTMMVTLKMLVDCDCAVDDVVGAIPVHLFAGIWGTMAVLLTNSDATFMGQLLPIIIVGVFVFVVSLVIWIILNGVMGIRVSEEAEINGLDSSEMGMEAYPEFSKG